MFISPSHPICSCGKVMKYVKNRVVFVTVAPGGELSEEPKGIVLGAYNCGLYRCNDCTVKVLCGKAEKPFATRSRGDDVMAKAREAVQGKEEFIFMEKI